MLGYVAGNTPGLSDSYPLVAKKIVEIHVKHVFDRANVGDAPFCRARLIHVRRFHADDRQARRARQGDQGEVVEAHCPFAVPIELGNDARIVCLHALDMVEVLLPIPVTGADLHDEAMGVGPYTVTQSAGDREHLVVNLPGAAKFASNDKLSNPFPETVVYVLGKLLPRVAQPGCVQTIFSHSGAGTSTECH